MPVKPDENHADYESMLASARHANLELQYAIFQCERLAYFLDDAAKAASLHNFRMMTRRELVTIRGRSARFLTDQERIWRKKRDEMALWKRGWHS